jgi:uncharacterized membrane protein YidH (DUF202 family)
MDLLALTLLVPFALDGESVSTSNTAVAVVSVISIVGGYLLLAALWHFVFREKARDKRKNHPPD